MRVDLRCRLLMLLLGLCLISWLHGLLVRWLLLLWLHLVLLHRLSVRLWLLLVLHRLLILLTVGLRLELLHRLLILLRRELLGWLYVLLAGLLHLLLGLYLW